ncbi:MAG: GatB/YqeY domain-containing protein [Planctomycetes bacterium]|nr:GatB/YqeY domain-containing protein [Planctomycetota bacterium]
MSLEARIKDDIKAAMKSGNKDDLEVLRMVISDVKNTAIAEGLERAGFDDELVLRTLRRGIKTRTESAEMYEKAGRNDLSSKERAQIEVLERYLPAQMSVAELEVVVDTVIVELGASTKKDMGRVIKEVVARVEGRADGKAVSSVVGGRLS